MYRRQRAAPCEPRTDTDYSRASQQEGAIARIEFGESAEGNREAVFSAMRQSLQPALELEEDRLESILAHAVQARGETDGSDPIRITLGDLAIVVASVTAAEDIDALAEGPYPLRQAAAHGAAKLEGAMGDEGLGFLVHTGEYVVSAGAHEEPDASVVWC